MDAIGNGPPPQLIVDAPGFGPFSRIRHRHIGSVRLPDPCELREDGLEVFPVVAGQGSRYVLPDTVTGSNKHPCPSMIAVILSHLLDNSDLLHEKPGPCVLQLMPTFRADGFLFIAYGFPSADGTHLAHTAALSGHAQVLARGAGRYDIDGFNFKPTDFRNISVVFHPCPHLQ